MKSPLIAVLASVLLLAACGDDGENNTTANNTAANNTSGTTSNNTSGNTATNNTTSGDTFTWSVSVAGGDEALTPAGGISTLVVSGDSSASVTGQDFVRGTSLAITFGTAISVGEVAASETSIIFKAPDYRCVSTSMSVTFTSIDPAAGSFTGPVTCASQADASVTFEATATGEFEQ